MRLTSSYHLNGIYTMYLQSKPTSKPLVITAHSVRYKLYASTHLWVYPKSQECSTWVTSYFDCLESCNSVNIANKRSINRDKLCIRSICYENSISPDNYKVAFFNRRDCIQQINRPVEIFSARYFSIELSQLILPKINNSNFLYVISFIIFCGCWHSTNKYTRR